MTVLVLHFVLGGAIVTVFAATGELWTPKTFAGLFGAAPSVAIATLALAFRTADAATIATEARSMLVGSVALLVYALACVRVTARPHVPVWAVVAAAWIVWAVVAFGLLAVLRAGGLA